MNYADESELYNIPSFFWCFFLVFFVFQKASNYAIPSHADPPARHGEKGRENGAERVKVYLTLGTHLKPYSHEYTKAFF